MMPSVSKHRTHMLTLADKVQKEQPPSIAITLLKNDSSDNIDEGTAAVIFLDINLPTEKRHSMKSPDLRPHFSKQKPSEGSKQIFDLAFDRFKQQEPGRSP